MTENLDKALRSATRLSAERQDEIATFVLAAVAAEQSPLSLSADQVAEVEARLLEE